MTLCVLFFLSLCFSFVDCRLPIVFTCGCRMLPNVVNCCQMLSTVVNCCLLLSTVANCCKVLPIAVSWRVLSPVGSHLPNVVDFCRILQCHPLFLRLFSPTDHCYHLQIVVIYRVLSQLHIGYVACHLCIEGHLGPSISRYLLIWHFVLCVLLVDKPFAIMISWLAMSTDMCAASLISVSL